MNEIEAKKNITAYVYMEYENMPSDVIKALDVAREALEKQMPKKPKLVTRLGEIIKFYPCPFCSTPEKYIQVYPNQKYCVECGQKLDWSDEE